MKKRILAPALAASLIVACSSPAPIYTQQEITEARSQGNLSLIYDTLEQRKAGLKEGSKQLAEVEAQIASVGRTLALDKDEQVRNLMKPKSEEMEFIPLATLNEVKQDLIQIRKWDVDTYNAVATEYNNQQKKTIAAIKERKTEFDSLKDTEAGRKHLLLGELADLHGGAEGETYRNRQAEYVDNLYSKAVAGLESKNYAQAQEFLAYVKTIDPEYKEVGELTVRSQAGGYEQAFWSALGEGRTEDAYQQFRNLSTSDGFETTREQIADVAEDLAHYFVTVGAKAMKNKDSDKAYQAFKRTRFIRAKLDNAAKYEDAEKQFISSVEKWFESAKKKDEMGIAYGYLKILEEMDPSNTTVKRQIRPVREQVLELAAVKLSGSPMSDASPDRAYGKGMTSKINQFLLSQISDDIRLIERSQFEDRYKQVDPPGANNMLSYYYMEGEIQQSDVDTSVTKQTRKERVVTGYTETISDAWNEWDELSDRKKKNEEKYPEPEKIIRTPNEEDVEIEVTTEKKVGVFAVIFRLVDPYTANIQFVDSVTEKMEFEGEGQEGMSIGEFSLEAKVPDLPSDSEILEQLSEKVSELVGQRLIEELRNPESKYVKYGARAIEELDMIPAATNFAYASVLTAHKGNDAFELEEKLREVVVKTGVK